MGINGMLIRGHPNSHHINPIQPVRGPLDPELLSRGVKILPLYIFLNASVTFPEILSAFICRKQNLIISCSF